jgi:putative endonuclease
MNKRSIGRRYEEQAVSYLKKKGWTLLARNFRCHQGEIDLIFLDGGCLVFVEVKYRTSNICGYPEASVTPAKQQTIQRVAEYYLVRYGYLSEQTCRFDVIAVYGTGEILHYCNAFGSL